MTYLFGIYISNCLMNVRVFFPPIKNITIQVKTIVCNLLNFRILFQSILSSCSFTY